VNAAIHNTAEVCNRHLSSLHSVWRRLEKEAK